MRKPFFMWMFTFQVPPPFSRALLLLEDAKILLRKRKLCPNNLCHQGFTPVTREHLGTITAKNQL